MPLLAPFVHAWPGPYEHQEQEQEQEQVVALGEQSGQML